MDNFFKQFDIILEEDLSWFGLIKNGERKGETNNKIRRKHKEFIKYLVSVATHPIGLRASVEPFNCRQEHMLAFIMDMFKLTEAKVRKMIIVNEGDNKQKTGKQVTDTTQPLPARKRHSWRPELRIRLNPPTSFYNSQAYLDNLYVRVYLFKEERTNNLISSNGGQDFDRIDTKSKGILSKIFKRIQLKPSKLIRPINELRHLVKFQSSEHSDISTRLKSTFKMVEVVDGTKRLVDDIYINIRRYYCEPEASHILRFEFWLDTRFARLNFVDRYRFYVRRLVYNGCLSYFYSKKRSTYMNERQELYGYINIKMTQLPSYPIKQNCSILTLQDRKINNCDIRLDIRNRRIREEDKVSKKKDFGDIHVINHLRLYANSMVYQCSNLDHMNFDILSEKESYQNITIDNLFYLPAYSLINQHRLQSNLSRFEDQSIRRVSFLLLLMKLNQQNFISGTEKSRFERMSIICVSVIQNEYMMINRSIDERTLQEVDPFYDAANSNVLSLELSTLRRFIKLFLRDRLKDWLLKVEMNKSSESLGLFITLNSLRMFKSAILNLMKCIKIKRLTIQLRSDLSSLKVSVNRILCEMILTNLSVSIENIAYSTGKLSRKLGLRRESTAVQNSKIRPSLIDKQKYSSWAQLLHKVNCINQDLSLYWSRSGLDGLIMNEREFVEKLNMFQRLEKRNFRKYILEKIDNYLK